MLLEAVLLLASQEERLRARWERRERREEAGGWVWRWGRSRTVVFSLDLVSALE